MAHALASAVLEFALIFGVLWFALPRSDVLDDRWRWHWLVVASAFAVLTFRDALKRSVEFSWAGLFQQVMASLWILVIIGMTAFAVRSAIEWRSDRARERNSAGDRSPHREQA